jgi:hypothetical protein
MLEHGDPGLSLPLYRASDGDDVLAEWQSGARVLGMPLLVADADGRLREPFAHIGAITVAAPTPRRRQRTTIRRRRPTLPLRRRRAQAPLPTPAVYRNEREIIARH